MGIGGSPVARDAPAGAGPGIEGVSCTTGAGPPTPTCDVTEATCASAGVTGSVTGACATEDAGTTVASGVAGVPMPSGVTKAASGTMSVSRGL